MFNAADGYCVKTYMYTCNLILKGIFNIVWKFYRIWKFERIMKDEY